MEKTAIEKKFHELQDYYLQESEVCMAELLATLEVPTGMTFEEAFGMYIALMKWSDGDKFYTIKEEERIEL